MPRAPAPRSAPSSARAAPGVPRTIVRAETGAQVEQHRLQARFVDLPRYDQHPEAASVERGGEQLPVAAVSGDDDDRAALRARRLDMLPTLERQMPEELCGRQVAQMKALAEECPEMDEAALGERSELAHRKLGVGKGQMIERAPAVAARHPPGEAAEGRSEPLRARPAQSGEEEIEEPPERGEQRRAQSLAGGAPPAFRNRRPLAGRRSARRSHPRRRAP
jgi:hypothetical protein